MTDDAPFDADLLGRCISCGFCLPACPTYALTSDEASSPRGRINLMRGLQDGTVELTDPTLRHQASFCLGCRACEPVCPAGVQYGQLLEQWRDVAWRGRRAPLIARLLTVAVRFSPGLRLAGVVRRAGVLRRPRLDRRVTRRVTRTADNATGDLHPTVDPGAHLMLGCFERILFPQVSRAARTIDERLRVDTNQGCCGALHAHNGDSATGHRLAEELGQRLPGRIVTTSGGCAAHLASVLGRDRVSEFSEHVTARSFGRVLVNGRTARVALQDSCHLRNGLGVWREPRDLLRTVAEYVELRSAATCCGAAGTYAMLRPDDSAAVLSPKLDEIEAAGLDYLVVVNPGCQRQLIQGLRRRRSPVRVVHLAELLASVTLEPATDTSDRP